LSSGQLASESAFARRDDTLSVLAKASVLTRSATSPHAQTLPRVAVPERSRALAGAYAAHPCCPARSGPGSPLAQLSPHRSSRSIELRNRVTREFYLGTFRPAEQGGIRTAKVTRPRHPQANAIPPDFKPSITWAWYCRASGVRGRRMPSPMSPMRASAHLTGMGLDSTNMAL